MQRPLVATLVLALALAAAAAGTAHAVDDSAPIQVCGRVVAFRAPSPTASGSVTVGTRTLGMRPGTGSPAVNASIRIGADLCVGGRVDNAGSLLQYGAFAFTSPFCGNVSSYTTATASRAGAIVFGVPQYQPELLRLLVPAGTALDVRVGSENCFVAAVNGAGDGVLLGTLPVAPIPTAVLGTQQAPQQPPQAVAPAPRAVPAPNLPSTSTR